MAADADVPYQTLRGTVDPVEEPPSSSNPYGQHLEAGVSAPEGVTFLHETDAFGRTHATFLKDGKHVGSAEIRDFGHSIQITNFQIARGARRKGIGTAFQSYIEAQLGKRAVPDGMLSKAEYRRWKKVDPVAVQDYVKGTKTYIPRSGSDAHFAAQGGPPVPGSRASQDRSARTGLLTPKPAKPRRKRPARPSGRSQVAVAVANRRDARARRAAD